MTFGCHRLSFWAEISETIEEVPGYDVMADRESEAQGFAEQVVECSECVGQFTVNVRNTGAFVVAELAEGEAIVSVVDDTIHDPDDQWGVEAYQRENLPTDPAKIFKSATYDLDHIGAEMEVRGSIGALDRMLLVQYFSAIEAYLADRLIRLVLDDPEATSALVKGNKEWVTDTIGVVELASNPDAFRNWVQARPREWMYHNFVKIDLYYRSALGSTIFPDETTKRTLMGRCHVNSSVAGSRVDRRADRYAPRPAYDSAPGGRGWLGSNSHCGRNLCDVLGRQCDGSGRGMDLGYWRPGPVCLVQEPRAAAYEGVGEGIHRASREA
jgi:hypothetical protein